jgi:hypothetical protein
VLEKHTIKGMPIVIEIEDLDCYSSAYYYDSTMFLDIPVIELNATDFSLVGSLDTSLTDIQEKYLENNAIVWYLYHSIIICLCAAIILLTGYIFLCKTCAKDEGYASKPWKKLQDPLFTLIGILFSSFILFLIGCPLASVSSIIYLRHYETSLTTVNMVSAIISFTGFIYPIVVLLWISSPFKTYVKSMIQEQQVDPNKLISAKFLLSSLVVVTLLSITLWFVSVIGKTENMEIYGLPWMPDLLKFNIPMFVIRLLVIVIALFALFRFVYFIFFALNYPLKHEKIVGELNYRGIKSSTHKFDPNSQQSPSWVDFNPDPKPQRLDPPPGFNFNSESQQPKSRQRLPYIAKTKRIIILMSMMNLLFLVWVISNIAYIIVCQLQARSPILNQPQMYTVFLMSQSWPHLCLPLTQSLLLLYIYRCFKSLS